jgi:hydroxymethylpyrimidine/phosphomethylpyrimidine kinase
MNGAHLIKWLLKLSRGYMTIHFKALSIAGFDGSGGAGLQADLKTFSALGCYGMTVLTALPVQNTCGVKSCYEIPLQAIDDQLHAIFEDITPDSIKIGMLYTGEIINLVADFLEKHAQHIPIVLDPVAVAKSGDALLKPDAIDSLINRLIPLTFVITPNLPEAQTLLGETASTSEAMPAIAKQLLTLGSKHVLLKGGHLTDEHSNDLLLSPEKEPCWLTGSRIESKNTHGTGCTLSSAIAAFLARGYPIEQACREAKHYVFNAILAAQKNSVGKGNGPVHHFYQTFPKNLFYGEEE